jgi:pyridinium-3,5-biscarboxylic acid mononucleotide sulfurtransferase
MSRPLPILQPTDLSPEGGGASAVGGEGGLSQPGPTGAGKDAPLPLEAHAETNALVPEEAREKLAVLRQELASVVPEEAREKLAVLRQELASVVPEEAREKLGILRHTLASLVPDGVLVAFSGGMDSAFLLWAAAGAGPPEGGRVVALTTISESTPERDKGDALAFAEPLAVEHVWRESRELSSPAYARNDLERCYHCKTELFRIAGEVAEELGLRWLLYGYNASDRFDFRPGHRAAEKAGVLTPLAGAGLTKGEIRFLMEEEGLPLSGKPASPCLSSRVMTGVAITPQRLKDVEAMEKMLRDAGITTLRVRVCRDADARPFLRVEVGPEEMDKVLLCREALHREGIRRGYRWVTLDLGGYRTGGGVS